MRYNLDILERHPILSEKAVLKLKSHKEFLERERDGISRRIDRIEKILSK